MAELKTFLQEHDEAVRDTRRRLLVVFGAPPLLVLLAAVYVDRILLGVEIATGLCALEAVVAGIVHAMRKS